MNDPQDENIGFYGGLLIVVGFILLLLGVAVEVLGLFFYKI